MPNHVHIGKVDKPHRPFSLLLFAINIVVSLAILLGSVRIIAPSVWDVQVHASWWALGLTFVSVHMVNAFCEFFFHRYMLHAPLVPMFRRLYTQHTLHHALTHVAMRRPGRTNATGQPVVENMYPILQEDQHEASFFPWYSLVAFSVVATPVFALVQWLLPHAPIFIAGYLSIAWSMCLYEIFHAIQHWSLEKWQPLLESRRFGRFWKLVYAFHLRHHADIKSNESISGFFGVPVADLVFGTWVNPMSLYEHGSAAIPEDFETPTPRFIAWLDKLAARSLKNRRLLGKTTI